MDSLDLINFASRFPNVPFINDELDYLVPSLNHLLPHSFESFSEDMALYAGFLFATIRLSIINFDWTKLKVPQLKKGKIIVHFNKYPDSFDNLLGGLIGDALGTRKTFNAEQSNTSLIKPFFAVTFIDALFSIQTHDGKIIDIPFHELSKASDGKYRGFTLVKTPPGEQCSPDSSKSIICIPSPEFALTSDVFAQLHQGKF